jgi:non-heme chloroperoxidase
VGKARGWLIAPSILIGLVAATGLGRYALSADVTRVGSTSAVLGDDATNDVSCVDTSPHETTFVTVEPGVRLEVLDWGGAGDPMVLLTGNGDNAHVYDEFAFQFTDRFHVIGITRRGFGRSSQPAQGYDLDTRVRDDIAVLDTLGIRQAVFVGHSIAGTELNKLAAAYPGRVGKLVYLDALDIGAGGWAKLAQPPGSPELTATDLESVQRVAAAQARDDGYRKPLAAICNMVRRSASGKIIGAVTPPEIPGKLLAGLQPAVYERIHAPTLGIFNRISPPYRMPYYWALKPAGQVEFDRSIVALAKWTDVALQRFRSEVKGSHVVEIPNTNHYVFIVEEALVVREMRRFLLGN